jgi:hypothetical protein
MRYPITYALFWKIENAIRKWKIRENDGRMDESALHVSAFILLSLVT